MCLICVLPVPNYFVLPCPLGSVQGLVDLLGTILLSSGVVFGYVTCDVCMLGHKKCVDLFKNCQYKTF